MWSGPFIRESVSQLLISVEHHSIFPFPSLSLFISLFFHSENPALENSDRVIHLFTLTVHT